MWHLKVQEGDRVRHEYYLAKDMEVPLYRRKPFYVCYTYPKRREIQF
jgi:hypothetical protein